MSGKADDRALVERYLARDEGALAETQRRFGAYCRSIARGILHDESDAEEIVNDTLLAAWNSIPPHEPENLGAYLGRLTRRLSVSRFRQRTAAKRGGGEVPLVLDELAEVTDGHALRLPAGEEPDGPDALAALIDAFLRTLPDTERRVFLCRYWYAEPVKDIAARMGMGESRVKMMLLRTREKLRTVLEREGYSV